MSAPGDWAVVNLPSGRKGIARRGATLWELEYPTAGDVSYVNANPRPEGAWAAPTIPLRRQFVGRNLALQNSPLSIGFLTEAFTGGSAASMTLSRHWINRTGRTVSSIRLMIPVTANTDNCTFTGRIARIGAGNIEAPAGAWAQVTWSSANSYTPANGTRSNDSPLWVLSDDIILDTPLAPNAALAIWWGLSGGADKVVALPAENTKQYSPLWYGDGKVSQGDHAAAAAGGSPSWVNVDIGGPDIQMLVSFTDTESSDYVVNYIAIGDSTFAEEPPIPQVWGNGWTTTASALARTAGKKWQIRSFGQGAHTTAQMVSRLQSLADSGILAYVDGVIVQGWSWNDRGMGVGGTVNDHKAHILAAKGIVLTAGRAWGCLTISPPGQGDGPIPTNLAAADLDAYDEVDAWNTTQHGAKYANLQSATWDPLNHRAIDTSNSNDNVHQYIGGGVGQDLQAAAAVTAMDAIVAASNYV